MNASLPAALAASEPGTVLPDVLPDMLSANKLNSPLLGYLAPVAVGALIFCLSVWGWNEVRNAEHELVQLEFTVEANKVRTAVRDRMRAYELVLKGGVGLFEARGQVSREEWRTYVETLRLAEDYPGIQGMGFAQVIAPSERDAHVREIRSRGFPKYRMWPAGERSSYTSIIYLEPFDVRNRRAFGYDMFSQPTRREAMERARDSGRPAVSGRVVLVQETGKDVQAGFLTYVPVYKKGLPRNTATQRKAALRGYVYSAFRMNDLMAGILGDEAQNITLRIYDGDRVAKNALMFVTATPAQSADFRTVTRTRLGGRSWTLEVASRARFDAGSALEMSTLLLVAGLIVSVLFMALTWLIMNMHSRALAYAGWMTAALRKSERQFRAAIDYSAVGMALVAPDGRWKEVNQALVELLGYSREELLASDLPSIRHPDDLAEDVDMVGKMLNREISSYRMEKRYLRKDGTYVWVLLSVALVWNDDGTPLHFISQIQDISERRQREAEIWDMNAELERRVLNRTSDLELANEELAAFSYSVSHDLRAPLRSIHGFSQALEEDYGDKLDDDGKDFIKRVCEATGRMERLIDDMLKLSRINRNEMEFSDIDLSASAETIASRLREDDPSRNVSLEIAPGLTAKADQELTGILLENLLGNAWKYSAKQEHARIEFGAMDGDDGETVFFVRDNGAGFDMSYADKLFKPFQRLHSASDFEGTGIGLATVARIVRRHGGRIWAEASPGEGATFYFTLPAKGTQETS